MGDPARVRLLLFRLGPYLSAAPAVVVREILPAGRPTRIPGADRAVAGLLNVRGTLLTVVDGRRAAGIAETGGDAESVLVLERENRAWGLTVDEVLDLVEVAVEDLEAGPAPAGMDPRLVRSVGRHAGRSFTVLDTDRLLAPALD
jgi:purine-binding chemotaxis protein CheW